MLSRTFITLMFNLLFVGAFAQNNWKLVSDEQQIRIFSQSVPGSKIKAIKVDCAVEASMTQLVALLLDVEAGEKWVYKTKTCVLVRRVSPSELYYYSEIELPWPLENRDFVAHITVTQDPVTKIVTVDGPVVSGMVGLKKGVVRVSQSKGHWILTPLTKTRIKIEYNLHTDPGGNIPAWAVNAFAAEGPRETFKGMKQHLKLVKYKNASLDFIKN